MEDWLRIPVRRSLADVEDGPIRDRLMRSLNLMDNSTRGRLAEVLVAELIDGDLVGDGYGSWDIELGRTSIEVKASGTVQSWPQRRPSRPVFSIARSAGWIDQSDHTYLVDPEKRRRSDLYVFCHHCGVVPDDPAEWTFRVVATRLIDHRCGDQRSISLASIEALFEPVVCAAPDLRKEVDRHRRGVARP